MTLNPLYLAPLLVLGFSAGGYALFAITNPGHKTGLGDKTSVGHKTGFGRQTLMSASRHLRSILEAAKAKSPAPGDLSARRKKSALKVVR